MQLIRVLTLVTFAVVLTGCPSPFAVMRTTLSAVGEMQVKGQQAAESAYQAEQEACPPPPAGDPCVAKVRVDWTPVKQKAVQLYVAYSVALATYQAASATYEATKTWDAQAVADAVAQLIQAAEAWRKAIASHGGTVLAAGMVGPLLPAPTTTAAPAPPATPSVLPAPAPVAPH